MEIPALSLSEDITLNDLFRIYLETKGVSPKTDRSYKMYWHRIAIAIAIGSRRVIDFTKRSTALESVQALNRVCASITSTHILKGTVVMLRGIFNFGQKLGVVTTNPAYFVKIPKLRPHLKRTVTNVEFQSVYLIAPERMRIAMALARLAGLRHGECIHLRWEDVDFVARQINVRCYDAYEVAGQLRPGFSTKDRDDRTLPMPAPLETILRHWQRLNGFATCVLDVRHRDGRIGTYTSIKGGFYDLVHKTSVKPYRFHDLRTTFLSSLANAGVPIVQLAALAGHASTDMTSRYYLDADLKSIGDVIAKVV